MTTENWGALALVLLGFALLCSLPAWTAAGRRIWAPVTLVVVLAAGGGGGRARPGARSTAGAATTCWSPSVARSRSPVAAR